MRFFSIAVKNSTKELKFQSLHRYMNIINFEFI